MCILEFKKQVLRKLNNIIYKIGILERKIDIFEEKQTSDDIDQEYDIQLPISTVDDLASFEEQLQQINFKNAVV